MYDISRKKHRWYRRECRRLIKFINSIKPNYVPEPPLEFDECIKIYANLFFKPKGKHRKDLMAALLKKTEEIIAGKPNNLRFCRVILAVYENNIAWSQIIIFFDEEEYNRFWDRTNVQVQKWTKIDEPSFAKSLGLNTDLSEICYWEEVQNDEENFKQKIRFYGEVQMI